MIVLAVAGWKGSGKDTMAEYLSNDYGYIRVAFADVLKELVAEQYGIPLEACHTPELKELPLLQYPVSSKDGFSKYIHDFMVKEFRSKDGKIPTKVDFSKDGETVGLVDGEKVEIFWTPRALCILEGSVKRSVNSSYWVQKVIDKINATSEANPRAKFIITDMRYKSEAEQLADAWPETLVTCRICRFLESPSDDPSERDLDDYELDYEIDNTDSLSVFMNSIDDVVSIAEGSVL